MPFVAFVLITASSFAQYDPTALGILDAMSSKYQELNSFKAQIVYSMVNDTEGINEDFKGEIFVRGNMYRLKTDEQEIINNGETL